MLENSRSLFSETVSANLNFRDISQFLWRIKNIFSLFSSFSTLCRFFDIAQKSKDELVSLGFPQFTLEDFHDTVSNALILFLNIYNCGLVGFIHYQIIFSIFLLHVFLNKVCLSSFVHAMCFFSFQVQLFLLFCPT